MTTGGEAAGTADLQEGIPTSTEAIRGGTTTTPAAVSAHIGRLKQSAHQLARQGPTTTRLQGTLAVAATEPAQQVKKAVAFLIRRMHDRRLPFSTASSHGPA